jgi:hypothetical protein
MSVPMHGGVAFEIECGRGVESFTGLSTTGGNDESRHPEIRAE